VTRSCTTRTPAPASVSSRFVPTALPRLQQARHLPGWCGCRVSAELVARVGASIHSACLLPQQVFLHTLISSQRRAGTVGDVAADGAHKELAGARCWHYSRLSPRTGRVRRWLHLALRVHLCVPRGQRGGARSSRSDAGCGCVALTWRIECIVLCTAPPFKNGLAHSWGWTPCGVAPLADRGTRVGCSVDSSCEWMSSL
jgi:hypothetical protein